MLSTASPRIDRQGGMPAVQQAKPDTHAAMGSTLQPWAAHLADTVRGPK